MEEFNIILGNRIRNLREECGYTREKFAELADINDKYLYEIESGRKGLSAKKLYNISHAFGISMDFLVTGRAKKRSKNRDFPRVSGHL